VEDIERNSDNVKKVDVESPLNHAAEFLMAMMMRMRKLFLARENEAMCKDKVFDRVDPHRGREKLLRDLKNREIRHRNGECGCYQKMNEYL
jgi:hypothetical protein